MRVFITGVCLTISFVFFVDQAVAQSSSLYLVRPAAPVMVRGQVVNQQLQAVSYTAVSMPEPRHFAVHDIITIVIRESASAKSAATLETNKEYEIDAGVDAFPMFDLYELIRGRLQGSEFNNGVKASVGVSSSTEFEGDGEYGRRDEMIARIAARVIDVKPNGVLVLEARKQIKNDDEVLEIKLTGYCRAEDVGPDNTVLSTNIADLWIEKEHKGELKRTAKKGILTKIMDLVFNF